MCTIDDLKEMSIPLGPRKKLAKFVKEKSAKQANILFHLYCIRCHFLFFRSNVTTYFSHQAARQARAEKTVVKEEPKETPAPESTPDPASIKLPVGRSMSSVHVNYNYFEIGTGQVR